MPNNSLLPFRHLVVRLHEESLPKGLNQLHSLGFTHGDVKVANFVLTNGCRVLKLIDLDTVKREDDCQQSGTKGYVAPEVRTRDG